MNHSNIIIYTTEDGLTKIETTFEEDTVWLSIDQMAELFQRDRSVIGKHVRNIFKEGELEKNSVWAKFAYTASDGKDYNVDYYNLDVIISVGYRVKSHRGTQFRIWAMGILKEYMKKGFALDDDRLKRLGGGNYFDELLARIRDIRSSEKVFWRKVLEIYATSIDYDPNLRSFLLLGTASQFFTFTTRKSDFDNVSKSTCSSNKGSISIPVLFSTTAATSSVTTTSLLSIWLISFSLFLTKYYIDKI